MRSIATFGEIHIHKAPVDFRKQIDGLSAIVEAEMNLSPFSAALFVFASKDRRRIKLLYWDKTGFALWQKRLEEERFAWPKGLEGDVIKASARDIEWLLEGFDPWKTKPHRALEYSCAF
jgi:transposase